MIDLHPKVVVVLAGTNDIAGVTGHTSDPRTSRLTTLPWPRLARASGWCLHPSSPCTITRTMPILRCVRAMELLALNKWLKDYCAKNRFVYLDYFSALVDERGMLKRALADDGLHPTDAVISQWRLSRIRRFRRR